MGGVNVPLQSVRDLGTAAERLLELKIRSLGISLNEAQVLVGCSKRPGITAVQLSGVTKVDPPVMSRIVHGLAQNELLTRHRSTIDRRVVMLYATPEGLALAKDCEALFLECEREFLRPLTPAQQDSFNRLSEILLGKSPG